MLPLFLFYFNFSNIVHRRFNGAKRWWDNCLRAAFSSNIYERIVLSAHPINSCNPTVLEHLYNSRRSEIFRSHLFLKHHVSHSSICPPCNRSHHPRKRRTLLRNFMVKCIQVPKELSSWCQFRMSSKQRTMLCTCQMCVSYNGSPPFTCSAC